METKEITLLVRLKIIEQDLMGYTYYVFEKQGEDRLENKYLMCVRFPNWNQRPFEVNDLGFVTVRYAQEGVDKWFDGQKLIPYRHTYIIFLKFITYKEDEPTAGILLD